MHVWINALGARMGGALTYLLNLVRIWSAAEVPAQITFLVPNSSAGACQARADGHVHIATVAWADAGPLQRLAFDQLVLPRWLGQEDVGVMVSLANFAVLTTSRLQVLLVRDARYFSVAYDRWARRRFPHLWLSLQLRRPLVHASLRRATRSVVPTRALASDILRDQPGVGDRLSVVPHGIDHHHYRPREGPPTDGDIPLVVSSHHAPHKDFETVVRAVPLIEARGGRPVRLRLTGSPDESTPARRLGDTIHRLGLSERVSFAGRVAQADMPAFYAEGLAMIFPSWCESFGFPMLEAMACGRPVLAADTPVNREVCGEGALYFPPSDSEALGEQVVRLVRDPELRRSVAAAGQAKAASYSWERTARELWSHIETVSGSAG